MYDETGYSMLTDEIQIKLLARTQIKHLREPQDIAKVVLFRCSNAAGWVSSQILPVSAGCVQEHYRLR